MGKIVKFCASCDEGFAEKFSFCPNCASELSAFEMKPVAGEENAVLEDPIAEPLEISSIKSEFEEIPEVFEEPAVFEPINFSEEDSNGFDASLGNSEDVLDIEVEEPVATKEVVTVETTSEVIKPIAKKSVSVEEPAPMYVSQESAETYEPPFNAGSNDDNEAFHVTVVSEKGGAVRNGLLLSAFALIMFGFAGMMIYSLFNNLDDVASLNMDAQLLALLSEDPMQMEEEKELKKDDDKGGGGGGGGKNNPKPVTRGEMPTQTRTIQPPPMMTRQLTNPDIKIINTTQGDIKKPKRDRTGIPTGLSNDPSSGSGSGGGIGSGKGTGAGSGFETGEGSGSGSGSGSGRGDGTGSGTGDGRGSHRLQKNQNQNLKDRLLELGYCRSQNRVIQMRLARTMSEA